MNLPDWFSAYGSIIGFGVATAIFFADGSRERRRNRRLREIILLHHDVKTMARAAEEEQSHWAIEEARCLRNELREAEKREGIPR